jgi:sugar fermentation stimulation protein A
MIFPELVPGRFIRRDNRFRATVRVDGAETWAHVPNSGRLTELFTPERPIWLAPADKPGRKTAYDLKLVEYAGVLVSVDARLPNPLFAEALAAGRLPAFPQRPIQPEVRRGESRLDFRLGEGDDICWVETKSVTLVEEGAARFPDAPTARGRRHLETLLAAREEGAETAVVFIIQRPDAAAFAPHKTADPAFAAALRRAAKRGVAVRAFTCRVSRREIKLAESVPVRLGDR